MSTWTKFEDIEAWKKGRFLSQQVYEIIKNSSLSNDYDLSKQMKRSSGSIMDNIAEGFERGGAKEFIYFLGISKGSNAELISQLYRCLDQNYISQVKFKELYSITDEVSRILSGLISHLKDKGYKGFKFSEDANEYQAPKQNL
jgi:four helix bundle protein